MGELILKIINGQIENFAEPFSAEIRKLVLEMLETDCDKRPSINEILQKPFILRYIKLNLIKQMDLNQSTKENSEETIEIDEYFEREGLIAIENISFQNNCENYKNYKNEEENINISKTNNSNNNISMMRSN